MNYSGFIKQLNITLYLTNSYTVVLILRCTAIVSSNTPSIIALYIITLLIPPIVFCAELLNLQDIPPCLYTRLYLSDLQHYCNVQYCCKIVPAKSDIAWSGS